VYPAAVPTPFDHALAFALAVLFPIRAATGLFRRLKLAPPEALPALRRRAYREAIVVQWSLVAMLAALWAWQGRPWAGLGLTVVVSPGLIGVVAASLLMAGLVLRQRAGILGDAAALADVRAKMAALEVMLPHDRDELRRFYGLSITAGVCEELLYRAYLIWYVSQWTGAIQAVGLSGLVFGVGHAYQGWSGILKTGAFGVFLGAVYLVTGSIAMPMILHALMDVHSGHLVQRAYERDAWERARSAFAGFASGPAGGPAAAAAVPDAGATDAGTGAAAPPDPPAEPR
jgi:membrane protease YdiL (CAAX protease family)